MAYPIPSYVTIVYIRLYHRVTPLYHRITYVMNGCVGGGMFILKDVKNNESIPPSLIVRRTFMKVYQGIHYPFIQK